MQKTFYVQSSMHAAIRILLVCLVVSADKGSDKTDDLYGARQVVVEIKT